MKLNKVIAIPAIALTAGLSLGGRMSRLAPVPRPTTSLPVALAAIPRGYPALHQAQLGSDQWEHRLALI